MEPKIGVAFIVLIIYKQLELLYAINLVDRVIVIIQACLKLIYKLSAIQAASHGLIQVYKTPRPKK